MVIIGRLERLEDAQTLSCVLERLGLSAGDLVRVLLGHGASAERLLQIVKEALWEKRGRLYLDAIAGAQACCVAPSLLWSERSKAS